MAVADVVDFEAKMRSPFQVIAFAKSTQGPPTNGRPGSFWVASPDPGVAPTTAVAPTKATVGALSRGGNPSANAYFAAAKVQSGLGGTVLPPYWVILCDRLSHQGGLDGTATGTVTTNLPTAALTRYTDGVGVMAAIEVYSTIGATGSTITCSYTDQAGTSGRTSLPVIIGSAGFREVGRMFPLGLQAGDTGVRSIESSVLAGTTGSVGAFGYTLFRPLAWIPVYSIGLTTDFNGLLGGCGQLPEIVDDACLFLAFVAGTNSTGLLAGSLTLIEA